MRRTKIVCTIGPASEDEGVLRQMLRAGMNVARLNFSHGDHATHRGYIERLRRIAAEEHVNLAILQDLQGPRLRIGKIEGDGIDLQAGSRFVLTSRPVVGSSQEVQIEGVDLALEVGPGNTILIDDGQIELSVVGTTDTDVVCQVVIGGQLRSRKGINVPGVTLSIPTITKKDTEDLAFGAQQDVDFVAMSFVRAGADVLDLKQRLAALGRSTPVIAKIEKHEAVSRFDEILDAADGIMVARGDLGVEIPAEDVPIVQKMVIRKCNASGKPVITATQMLNSMIENPRPTRAEASDVANAIFDGTDAVMLSGETAVGQYPVVTVKMMSRIAMKAEEALPYGEWLRQLSALISASVTDSIGQATVEIARELKTKAIVTMTASGYTARMIARHRPEEPIVALTPNEPTLRQLALTWGVTPFLVPKYDSVDDLLTVAESTLAECGYAGTADQVVITAGLPIGVGGRTNLLKVHSVGESTRA
ncbi:MAG: pyruvate kinase [Chloroflexota bacterium]